MCFGHSRPIASASKSARLRASFTTKYRNECPFLKALPLPVRGRVMVDYNGIDQDEKITGEGDINAVELRRARLGVEGVVYYDWKYKFEIEFAGDAVEIKDAYLAYANWWGAIDTSEIRIGNQYVYTSLEQITSSRFITFLERAAFTDPGFLPSVEADRQIGAAIVVGDEHWSFQTGAYGASVGFANDVPGQEDFDDDKLALSVRGTVAPINREVNGVNQVLHLGASFRHRDAGTLNDCSPHDIGLESGSACENVGDDSALFQYRGRGADLHLADAFIDTPQFSDEDNMWHLEAAFVWGPFSARTLQRNSLRPSPLWWRGISSSPRLGLPSGRHIRRVACSTSYLS